MKQFNRIQLCGIVGYTHIAEFDNEKKARLGIAVNYRYLSASENEYTQVEWFDVNVSDKDTDVDLESIKKGDCVYVEGEIRSVEYMGSDNASHRYYTIHTDILKKVKEE